MAQVMEYASGVGLEVSRPPAYPLDTIQQMGAAIAKSGLFGVKTPEQAVALMLVAQAEGRHPASVAQDYHIIQGRPALKVDSILARFQLAGGVVEWEELTETRATARFWHPTACPKPVAITWTVEMARRAGLAGKEVWKAYPRAMLRARVVSEGVRAAYPAVCCGMYTPEEVEDMPAPSPPVAMQPPVGRWALIEGTPDAPKPEVPVDILGAPAPAEPPRAAPPKATRPTAPASGTPTCPKCGGAMWDNSDRRAEEQAAGKPKPCPAYKCRAGKWNKDTKQHEGCDGVIWPAHGEDDTRKPQAAPQPPPGGSDGAPIDYDTAPVAAVKSAIVAGRKRMGLTGAAEWHTWLTENSFPTAGTFSESELRAVARAIDDIPF